MKVAIQTVILILFYSLIGESQSLYQDECKMLKNVAFNEVFNFDKIENQLQQFQVNLETSTLSEYNDCNCSDTLWINLKNDKRKFTHYTHSPNLDTAKYLKNIIAQINIMNLNKEFQLYSINSVADSFEYVLKKIALQDFKYCNNAEATFLKQYKYKLKNEYFKIFDDRTNSIGYRDIIITSFFYSNASIETDILKRIPDNLDGKFFYRMLGILRTSGTTESVEYLTSLLKTNSFNLNEQKSILQVIYGIMDREKVKRKTRKKFNKVLVQFELDTLSRYDLYIKN